MTEMLERVARAVYESEVHGPDDGLRWENATARWRAIYLKRARVVIAVLMEPTAAMLDAGYRGAANALGNEEAEVWRAMIAEALTSKQEEQP